MKIRVMTHFGLRRSFFCTFCFFIKKPLLLKKINLLTQRSWFFPAG